MFGAVSLKVDFTSKENIYSANYLGKFSVAPMDIKQSSDSSKAFQRIMN